MLALAREALLSETLAPAWTVRVFVGPGMSYTGGDAMQTLRRGFRAKGAGWLRQELAKTPESNATGMLPGSSRSQSGAPRLGQTWLRLCALCASSANRRARSSTCSSIASVALIAVLLPSALGWCWTANAAQMKLWTASCRLGQLCNRGNAEIMLSWLCTACRTLASLNPCLLPSTLSCERVFRVYQPKI